MTEEDNFSIVSDVNDMDRQRWHSQHEKILAKWADEGASYRYLHDKAYKKFIRLNIMISLPTIILSTIAGTANFSQGSFSPDYQSYIALGTGFLNLSAGLITTIAQFLKIGELLEGHRVAAIDFAKLSRNIETELSLPRRERSLSGLKYINKCRTELIRLIETSPDINTSILKRFTQKFSKSNFTKPHILDIKKVNPYNPSIKKIPVEELQKYCGPPPVGGKNKFQIPNTEFSSLSVDDYGEHKDLGESPIPPPMDMADEPISPVPNSDLENPPSPTADVHIRTDSVDE